MNARLDIQFVEKFSLNIPFLMKPKELKNFTLNKKMFNVFNFLMTQKVAIIIKSFKPVNRCYY